KAIDMVLEGGRPGEVYNVGGHNERTNMVIIRTILAYLREHVDASIGDDLITHIADRKGHDRRYGIDPEKIKRELGWTPETRFEDGIVQTLRWYLDNPAWVEHVTSGAYQEYVRKMYGG
ncbi:MAG: GDP-mannose 4,6-dehydratase, partial [Oscillospiraceae bacterium]|nr:GDP-mannose 4,6-dehydratase [Oscillospiraceae bacterium]